jgi:twitching motility protein PilT
VSENIYEIPVGDGESYPPARGRRAADVPPYVPPVTDAGAPGFVNAPPTGAALPYSDPSPLPAPAFDPPVFDASAFDGPPAPSFSAGPSYEGFAAPTFPSFADPVTPAAPPAVAPAPTSAALPTRAEPTVGGGLAPQTGEGQKGSHPDVVAALNAVVTTGASDLHISVGAPPMLRVDGGLKPIDNSEVWDAARVNTALMSILSERERDLFEQELELDFAYTLSTTTRFRVNYSMQRETMSAAFRIIPTQIKPLETLGIPETVAKFAQLPRGLVLVTGPTGSGKSTTLAALIDLVNATRADHIVTVEDPIEFLHENKKSVVNQREVGQDTHSFQNALKHVLRQDPDVILIGELRDLETISTALTAAETGHLVFATLHTQDAAQTIDRILDVFPPHQQALVRTQLAGVLQGVVSQTLVKKVGGGRAVATEILVATPAISNLIREGKVYQIGSMMQAGRELGMHTMDQHLADLVNAGQISHQAAYDKAHSSEDLKQLIQRSERASQGSYGMGGGF